LSGQATAKSLVSGLLAVSFNPVPAVEFGTLSSPIVGQDASIVIQPPFC